MQWKYLLQSALVAAFLGPPLPVLAVPTGNALEVHRLTTRASPKYVFAHFMVSNLPVFDFLIVRVYLLLRE
jgi:hypothetical protein